MKIYSYLLVSWVLNPAHAYYDDNYGNYGGYDDYGSYDGDDDDYTPPPIGYDDPPSPRGRTSGGGGSGGSSSERKGCRRIPDHWVSASNIKLKHIETSGDDKHHWGISPEGDVYYRGKGYAWNSVPIPNDQMGFVNLSVSGDGDIVWGITGKGNDIYRRGGIDGDWFLVVDNAKNWIDVSVSADGKRIFALDEAGGVWDREGVRGDWVKRSGNNQEMDGTLFRGCYSENGEIGWAVDRNKNVFYRDGFLKKWKMVSGKLKYISMSADALNVVGVNSNHIIFYRHGKHDFWREMPGRAKQVSISADGNHIYAVDRNDDVFSFSGLPSMYETLRCM